MLAKKFADGAPDALPNLKKALAKNPKLRDSISKDLLEQVDKLSDGANGLRSPRFGKYVRGVDDFKHALDSEHVKAALREKRGEIAGINPKNGLPWDHLKETRSAMRGSKKRVILLKKYLSDPGISPRLRRAVEDELGELSRMLDNAENILGENAR